MIEGVAKIAIGYPIFQTFQETLLDLKMHPWLPSDSPHQQWRESVTLRINDVRSPRPTVKTSFGHISAIEQSKIEVFITII